MSQRLGRLTPLLVLAAVACKPAHQIEPTRQTEGAATPIPATNAADEGATGPGAASAARPPVPESAARVITGLLTAPPLGSLLPAGFSEKQRMAEPLSERSAQRGAAGKVTYVLSGPSESARLSFTVYGSAEAAAQSFASIGDPVAGRTVVERRPVTVPDVKLSWGEVSIEEYGGTRVARTTAAAVEGDTVALAQTVDPGAPGPDVESTIAKLLAAALELRRAAGAGAGVSATPAAR